VGLLECGGFGRGGLVAGLRCALRFVESFLHHRQVGEREFELDRLAIARRIHRAIDVDDVGVVEAAHHVHDGVGLADVAQERIAAALTLRRALHEPGDVDELHRRLYRPLRLHHFGECIEPFVGHGDHADVGVDGAEGVVGGLGFRGRQGVEEGGFADVGETYNS
jgi:hypothetical protein